MTFVATPTETDYAATAYRSDLQVPGPGEPSQQSAVFRKSWTMGPSLPKGQLSGVIPARFLELWNPAEIRDNERIDRERSVTELEERHTYHGRLDEECLRYATLPKTSWVLLWMQHGGRLGFIILFPLTILTWLFMWPELKGSMTVKEFWVEGLFEFFMYVLFPLLICWAIGRFLEKKFPHIVYQPPKGPLWELNRRTGLVTLFKNPNKPEQAGQIHAQAPFHEWDGYLLTLPDHQGNLWHRLALVHQTREWALPLNQLIAATPHREEVLAYWDLIRQYMDVTKPLPDIPLFESYRHLDPTTVEYDEQNGRDPQYWRDMDDETYKAFQQANATKLHQYQWD